MPRCWLLQPLQGGIQATIDQRFSRCKYDVARILAIVEQCQHAKLVWGRELYIDGIKVQANASKDSLKPRFFVEAHLSALFSDHPEDATGEGEQDARQDESAAAEPSPQGEKSSLVESPTSLSLEQRFELTQQNEERHKWIEQLGDQDRRANSRVYQRMADYLVSTTDPDATLMETTKGADMGYRAHYVVDGGKARIILGILVTPSEVMDNQPMRDLIFRTCFRYKLRPRYVRGDTEYGTADNIVALERVHIRAYVPIADLTQRTPFFRQEDFQYDARLGAASVPSRGDVCLLFGGFWVVYSSFVGVLVLFLADWIRLPNDQETMHPSLLMSFVGVFFNRLESL